VRPVHSVDCPAEAMGAAPLHLLRCHAVSGLDCPQGGVLQIILTLLEADQVNLQWVLEDPVEAVKRWSHDPLLQTRARLLSARK